MKALEELTADIREKLPRLRENKERVLDDGSFGIMFIEPRDPMLNDVLDWLSFTAKSESVIDFYGSIGEVVLDRGGYYITSLGKWDLSKPYLKDQSPELIKFLHGLIK